MASPGKIASVPETQWLCQEANPTVWVGTGVGLSILLPGEQLQCCGKSMGFYGVGDKSRKSRFYIVFIHLFDPGVMGIRVPK